MRSTLSILSLSSSQLRSLALALLFTSSLLSLVLLPTHSPSREKKKAREQSSRAQKPKKRKNARAPSSSEIGVHRPARRRGGGFFLCGPRLRCVSLFSAVSASECTTKMTLAFNERFKQRARNEGVGKAFQIGFRSFEMPSPRFFSSLFLTQTFSADSLQTPKQSSPLPLPGAHDHDLDVASRHLLVHGPAEPWRSR